MMMFPADVALATSRGRRRASTSARSRSLAEGKPLSSSLLRSSSSGARSFSGRRSALGLPDDPRSESGGASGLATPGANASAALPPAIALLEQVGMTFSTTKHQSDVRYVMTVRHSALRLAWRHARSFDEYRRLQHRLLKVLDHGHFCDADCPWLYTFLKSYFPKKHLFNFGASARVVDARKETLARFFSTLQGVLLNRANHVCAVLTTALAAELVSFIYGDALQQHGVGDLQQLLHGFNGGGGGGGGGFSASVSASLSPSSARGSLSFSMRKSGSLQLDVASMASFADDESGAGLVDDADNDYCTLCGSSLAGEAFASSRSLSQTVSSSEDDPLELSASAAAASNGSKAPLTRGGSGRDRKGRHYYTTTLGCGHQFHDECIVPKLNESLACPTCGHLESSDY